MKSLVDRIVLEEALRGNFVGPIEIQEGHYFKGVIHNMENPRISIQYNPDYAERTSSLAQAFPDREEQVVRSLVRHEINHKGYGNLPGCPGNMDMHIDILERISSVLKENGFPNVPMGMQGHTLYTYMANMFVDFIDNSQLGSHTDHTGVFLIYKENMKGKKLSPLFDAFVRLQEFTYGRKKTKSLLRSHHTSDPKVTEAVKIIIDEGNIQRGNLEAKLFDAQSWPDLADTFTKHMLPLIDKTQLSNPEYIQATFPILDGFPEELQNPETQMAIIWKKYMDGEASAEAFSPPSFLEDFLSLKLLYTRLARNLEIRTRASTKEEQMPVSHYGKRPFDFARDSFARTRVSFDNGSLKLLAEKYAVDIPINYHERPHSLPEIRIAILDTSSSTKERVYGKERARIVNPWAVQDKQWTDDSVYHHELLCWFGLLEFLKKQGALRKTSVHLANFSSHTEYAKDLDASYKLALSPQFGSTHLDSEKIFTGMRTKSLTFSITDGDVANWHDIREGYIKQAKRHWYFHIQVGAETEMSQDLHSAGIPVIFDTGKNLGKIVIDLTKPFVSGGVK